MTTTATTTSGPVTPYANIAITSHLGETAIAPAPTAGTVFAGKRAVRQFDQPMSQSGAGESFRDHLNRFALKTEDPATKTRDAAAGLVANALILPLLKQLRREESDTQTPFTPSNAENTFGTQFDVQIADRIAKSPRMTLTNVLAERLTRHSKPASKVDQNRAFGERMMPAFKASATNPKQLHPLHEDKWATTLKPFATSRKVTAAGASTGVDLHG